MLDWKTYREELDTGVRGLAKLSPDTVKGYAALANAGRGKGPLDDKTRELIALSVAITLRCDGCIAVHTEALAKLGASKEEIAAALGVAVSINAGAAVVYSVRAFSALETTTHD